MKASNKTAPLAMDGPINDQLYLGPEPEKNLLTTDPAIAKPNGRPNFSISESSLAGITHPNDPDPNSTCTPTVPSAVQRLPAELFVGIVQRYVDPWTPIRDLIRLILVCQRWRTIVEGTPTLWCRVTGNETMAYLRKGLEMSKHVHLDIGYDGLNSTLDVWAFLRAIEPHYARWKSLFAIFSISDFHLGKLETKPAPALEKLHLIDKYWLGWRRPVTLFGGAPAPPTLKDFMISGIRVALPPLRLGQVKRFKLVTHQNATTAEIVTALQGAPDLRKVELSNIGDPNDLTLAQGTIRLPLLNYLRISDIPQHMALQILSNISAPSLRTLRVTLPNTENPRIGILPALAHLISVMESIVSDALVIDVSFSRLFYKIRIGGLRLSFQSDGNGPDAGELAGELFDWLGSKLGGHLMDHPVTLSLDNCPASSLYADWLSSRVKVTKLLLSHRPVWGSGYSFDDVFPSLSNSNALSSTGWLLPHLESIETDLAWEKGNADLINMISIRQSAATHSSQIDERTPTLSPRRLREMRLWHGGRKTSARQPPDVEFMRAVRNAAVDAEVYWSGVSWEG